MTFQNSIAPANPNGVRPQTVRGSEGWRGLQTACIAVVIGSLDSVLLIGWHALDPANTDWLKSDPTVFQAGWEFLRRQPFTFPLTWISTLNFPFGISAAYLDVIPIVAAPLRLLSPILPTDFQYFGSYLALCLILQAYYGFRLVSRFTDDRVAILLGGLFFLDSPVLLSRLYVHFSLCSQWLILAALYYYFAPVVAQQRFRLVVPFVPLLALSAGVTPYLSVMVLCVGLAAVLRIVIENPNFDLAGGHASAAPPSRKPKVALLLKAGLSSSVLVATVAGSLLLFGFFIPGAEPVFKGAGYTMFSLNLLSPFDRHHFLPGSGYEGFGYLGLGVLLLIGLCLAHRPGIVTRAWTTRNRPLLIIAAALTLLALSVRIRLGQTILVTLPMPSAVSDVLAIFRASGRFFWPVYYLLILFAVVGTLASISGRSVRLAVIAAALLIQFVDVASLRSEAARQIRSPVRGPLAVDILHAMIRHDRHLVVLPAWQCGSSATAGGDAGWPQLAHLAARDGLTLNSVHSARISSASLAFNCKILPLRVRRGELRPDTAYILEDALAKPAMAHNGDLHCRRWDGLDVCVLAAARPSLGAANRLNLDVEKPDTTASLTRTADNDC